MAKIVESASNAGYANEHEPVVVKALAAALDESFTLYPNVQIQHQRGQIDEIDVLIVAEGLVWVVEVKSFRGNVSIKPGSMRVDGNGRNDPYQQTCSKARRIASKLKRIPELRQVWVQALVILDPRPKNCIIDEALRPQVGFLEGGIAEILNPSSSLVADRTRVGDPLQIREILHLSPRRPSKTFRSYSTGELLEEQSESLTNVYLASREGQAGEFILQHRRFPAEFSEKERKRERKRANRAIEAIALADNPILENPGDLWQEDDGSLVLVQRSPVARKLSDFEDIGGR